MARVPRDGKVDRDKSVKGEGSRNASARSTRALAFVSLSIAFFGVGAANAAFGPLLPELAGRTGLPLGQAGLMLSFIFLGVGVTSPIAGALSDRFGRVPILLFGILCIVIFDFGVTMSRSVPLLLALCFGVGVGGGIIVLGTNVLVVDLYGERSVSKVNLVNALFGAGAVTGPLFASLAWHWWQTAIPAFWFAIAITLTQFPILAVLQRRLFSTLPRSASGAEEAGTPAAPATSPKSILRSPLLWLFGVVLFFDVGTEQGLNGWTAVFVNRSTGLAMSQAALVLSGFWMAFAIGRLTASMIADRLSPKTLLRGSLLVGACGVVLINLGSGSAALSTAGFMLTGLGFGPVFPTVISRIGTTFRRTAGAATGIAALIGTGGGVFFGWLLGFVLEGNGPALTGRLIIAMLLAVVISLLFLDTVERASDRKAARTIHTTASKATPTNPAEP